MDKDNLVKDTIAVIQYITATFPEQSLVIVGHSMGGSIAVKTAHFIQTDLPEEEFAKHLVGVFVIDVVEGSAMDALPFMENIALKRP